MSKKVRILVACGSGIATSTVAADAVQSVCDAEGIDAVITKCSMQEMQSKAPSFDVVLTTNIYKDPIPKPYMSVFGLISGINEAKVRSDLAALLHEVKED